VESKLGPLGTSATEWPIVPAPGDYDDGEFGGMKIGRGNRSTRRKRTPAPLCPPQIPLDQTRARTRTAVVGNQRLTAWATARSYLHYLHRWTCMQNPKESVWVSVSLPPACTLQGTHTHTHRVLLYIPGILNLLGSRATLKYMLREHSDISAAINTAERYKKCNQNLP
jgi:hypothetical protein